MKLKKLLASCVLIAAMGITLTGCNLDIKGIVDEINSVVNDESSRDNDYESSRDTDYGNSSDTDYGNSNNTDNDSSTDSSTDNESSTDTNVENSNSGTWVLTETKYYAYMNGEEPYFVGEYTKYRCSYSVTDDNFVKLQNSGGYTSPTNPNDNSHIDDYNLCSIPDNSYPAGGPVTLQVKTYSENIKGNWYPADGAWIWIACEDKEEAAGMDPYLYFLQKTSIKFYSALKDKYDLWVDGNTNDTLTVNMPEEAKNSDRIAIVFQPNMANGEGGEYNAGLFAMWIYTFTE